MWYFYNANIVKWLKNNTKTRIRYDKQINDMANEHNHFCHLTHDTFILDLVKQSDI